MLTSQECKKSSSVASQEDLRRKRLQVIPLRITAIYCLSGILWFWLSDWLFNGLIRDPEQLRTLNTLADWGYLLLTAIMLYWLINRGTRRIRQSEADLRRVNEELLTAETLVRDQLSYLQTQQLTLRESQRKLRTLINNLPGIVFEGNPTAPWSMKYLSEGCFQLTGYCHTALIGDHPEAFNALIHADDFPLVLSAIGAAIAQKQPYEAEYRIRTKSGQERWVWEKGSGVFDGQGQLLGLEGFITDITELKHAEQALQEQQKLLRLILDNIPQQIFWKDRNSVYLGCNQSLATATGVANTDEIVGKTDQDLGWHPDDVQRFLEQDVQVMQAPGSTLHWIERHWSAKDQYSWFDIKKMPIQDTKGTIVGVLGTIEDITERKQAQEDLERSLSLFKATLESIAEGLIAVTTGGEIVTFNQKFLELWQLTPEIMGLSDANQRLGYMMAQFQDPTVGIQGMREICAHPDCERNDRIELRDGRVFERYTKPQWAGERIVGRVWSYRDITARVRAEAALQASEEKYREVVNSLQEVIFQQDTDGRWIFLNPAWSEVMGYSVDETLGHSFLDYIHPDDHWLAHQQLQILLAPSRHAEPQSDRSRTETADSPTEPDPSSLVPSDVISCDRYRCEIRYLAQDGSLRWLDMFAKQRFNVAGEVVGTMGTLMNITQRKQAELELQTLNLELERQVQERTAQLQDQMQELQRVNSLKDDFLSTVSHELRTPMANMKMAIHMLAMSVQTVGSSEVSDGASLQQLWQKTQRYLKILETECDREISLINDLLDLQRLETASQPLEIKAIVLQEWLLQLVHPFQVRAHNRQQTLEAQIPTELPLLYSDPHVLERVLAELLNNACKYTPPGGQIRVRVLADDLDTSPTDSTHPPATLGIAVWNSGSYIPPEELTRIFDKFYRIPRADPWKQGGTGLGLALVEKLVQQLHGKIWVESEPDQTRFIVELPSRLA